MAEWKRLVSETSNGIIGQDTTGNAATATSAASLTTSRTITLGGDLSGSQGFDGSSNITITATIDANAVDAAALNVAGNGSSSQLLQSDGDGSFSWIDPGSLGGGTVTSITAGNGMSFSEITGTGAVTLGTPGSLSAATSNGMTATSHTHAVTASSNPGGSVSLLKTTAAGRLTLASLVVTGDLEVQGSVTSIETTNLRVTDSVIQLNSLADNSDYATSGSAIILGNSVQTDGAKIVNTTDYIAFTELHSTDMAAGSLPNGSVTEGNYKQIRALDVVLGTQGSLPASPVAGLVAFDGTDMWLYI